MFLALGAMFDLFGLPRSPLVLRPAEDRVEGSSETLLNVQAQRGLSQSLAGKLYGKLVFMSS